MIPMEILHQRQEHSPTRSILAGDSDKVWKETELRVDPDLFCTSFQIPTTNKNPISRIKLNTKTPFRWVFIDIM